MLLINPPFVKPSEPPAGITRLAGSLAYHQISCKVVDLNLEGLLFLLQQKTPWKDTWSKRAQNGVLKSLTALQTSRGYENPQTYRRHVSNINRVLQGVSSPFGVRVTLSDYKDLTLSPTNQKDLFTAFRSPENSILYPFYEERLGNELDQFDTPYVGISVNYLSQALPAFSLAGFIKLRNPHKKIVMGGGLITSWMETSPWKNPFSSIIDLMVKGPGETCVLNLHGIHPEKSDCLPLYGDLSLDEYLSPTRILPYSASSGCYWSKCTFCPERYEKNRYVQGRSTYENIEVLKERFAPGLIHFTDSTLSTALLQRLSKEPLQIPWYGFSRIVKELEDKEFCQALKKSGCIMLKLGIESGSQKLLDALSKGVTLERVSKSLKNLQVAGILIYAYLLFGTPEEELADARQTLSFIAFHAEYIDFLNLAIFNMPSGYPDTNEFEKNHFYEGDLSLYTNFTHPKGWGRKEVRHFLDKEFIRHPAIAPIIKRDPPVFTSNHAPFF